MSHIDRKACRQIKIAYPNLQSLDIKTGTKRIRSDQIIRCSISDQGDQSYSQKWFLCNIHYLLMRLVPFKWRGFLHNIQFSEGHTVSTILVTVISLDSSIMLCCQLCQTIERQNRSTEGCSRLKRSVDMTSSGKMLMLNRTQSNCKSIFIKSLLSKVWIMQTIVGHEYGTCYDRLALLHALSRSDSNLQMFSSRQERPMR